MMYLFVLVIRIEFDYLVCNDLVYFSFEYNSKVKFLYFCFKDVVLCIKIVIYKLDWIGMSFFM